MGFINQLITGGHHPVGMQSHNSQLFWLPQRILQESPVGNIILELPGCSPMESAVQSKSFITCAGATFPWL